MPTITTKAIDGKTLSIDVPPGTDPSMYDGMVEDALAHYSGSIQAQLASKSQPKESFLQHEMGTPSNYSWGDISGDVALAGKRLNNYIQGQAGNVAEQSGAKTGIDKAIGLGTAETMATLAEFALPQNRLSAQLLGLQAIMPFLSSGAKYLGLTTRLEGAGQAVAKAGYEYTGMPATKAGLLSQNLGEASNPASISGLNNIYKNAANALGIKKLDEDLASQGAQYAGATGQFQKAVGEYSGKLGEQIVSNPIDSTYQQLHNVIESVSARLDAPWAYPGTENMRTLPEQMASDLYRLKQAALDSMQVKAAREVSMISDLSGEEGQAALSRLDAASAIPGIRKSLAISQTAEGVGFTPNNLGGSMNQLGTMALMSGAGEMVGSLVGHGSAGAMAGAGVAAAGIAKSPMLMNSAIMNARAGFHFLPYAPTLGPAVTDLINKYAPQESTSGK